MPWLDAAWHAPGWIDGETVPFHAADRGLLLGDGVFDTSLVLGGRMVWRAAHVARLLDACRTLGFEFEPERVAAAIDAVLARVEHGSLRVTVTRGAGPRGLAPPKQPRATILATSAPLRAVALFAPLKLHVVAVRRNDTATSSRVKSLNYLDGVLAAGDALRAGCDDALFLNTRDQVACTSVGNVFAVIGSQLVTPPVSDGAVPGIARGMLLGAAEGLGLAAVERSLTMTDLTAADAIFSTNSLRLVAPVVALDRRPVPDSLRGAAPMAHIAELVKADVGIDPRQFADL